jgi:hypothetical protein
VSLGNGLLATGSLVFVLVHAVGVVVVVAAFFALRRAILNDDQRIAALLGLGLGVLVLSVWFLVLAFSARGAISRGVTS